MLICYDEVGFGTGYYRKAGGHVKNSGWEQSEITLPLRNQIDEYVKKIVHEDLPRIPFEGYLTFRDQGSRIESERYYFNVRKQLTALGVYLQWSTPTEKEKTYFNELLWSVANEFTWCLAAHLPYDKNIFTHDSAQIIDLFAAETAETLSELIILHKEIIDPYVSEYIHRQINIRIFQPFLNKSWNWETSSSNWCAVCSGCIGMAALLLTQDDIRNEILKRVDTALNYYINSFSEDGACEEGIGYWVYGFGYYIYYLAMRQDHDSDYKVPKDIKNKLIKIGEFPQYTQVSENQYLPFSDVASEVVIPTGLVSYLQQEFNITPPMCREISSFHFDHCYRYAHISRTLWWTNKTVLISESEDMTKYYSDKQWLLQRKGSYYFAIKGGSNAEEHNHNDVGNFLIGVGGELILTDIGAGQYTADYFSILRYEHTHTRSYWHNLPVIQGKEQIPTSYTSQIRQISIQDETASISMELKELYEIEKLNEYTRSVLLNLNEGYITITDEFSGTDEMVIEEGFISYIKPVLENGMIRWVGKTGHINLPYDSSRFCASVKEIEVINHVGEREKIYRVGLKTLLKDNSIRIALRFLITN